MEFVKKGSVIPVSNDTSIQITPLQFEVDRLQDKGAVLEHELPQL